MYSKIRAYITLLPAVVFTLVTACAQPELATTQLQADTQPAQLPEQNQSTWPREISSANGVVVIYQPQPDKLDGNQLLGRMAVSVELAGADKPVFGALWFDARLETDRDTRSATIADVKITRMRFPTSDEQKADKLRKLLHEEIPKWQLSIDMDRLLTTLEQAEVRSEAAERINTGPPNILFISEPAVLISIDGEPRLKQETDSTLKRVINTPFTILFEPAQRNLLPLCGYGRVVYRQRDQRRLDRDRAGATGNRHTGTEAGGRPPG